MRHPIARASTLLIALFAIACDGRPRFDPAAIRAAPPGEGLPRTFVFGAASASHQIEGGNDNDWTEWENTTYPDGRPHIRNGDRSGRAADSWNLWPEDVRALRRLGANAYRFSIEWSRLEPREGEWDDAAFMRYREMLLALRDARIAPMLTLFHFTLPRWFSARGGWESPDAVATFGRFCERATQAFGDLVDDYITVNEPNVYAVQGYIEGIWPPGARDTGRAANVYANLLRGHAACVAAGRRVDTTDADGDGRATRFGIAHHVRIMQPASSSELDHFITALTDDFTNEVVPRAGVTGRIRIYVPGEADIDEEVPGLQGSYDFLGINYYTRDFVRADLGTPALSQQYHPADRPMNDLGWDLYPEGLYRFLVRFASFGYPIYVTENGIADEHDTQREYFLRSHLYAVQRAIAAGADVRGYFYWSLTDNFEWAEGYHGRFGLFAIDYQDPTLTRVMRPSANYFRDVARALGRTPEP